MKMFAVTGSPIGFSRSPDIFRAAFRETKFDGAYTRLAAGTAEEAARLMREVPLDGLSVTAPFKETIIPHLDALDQIAAATGAVNTIARRDGRLEGFNTDPAGVIGALTGAGVDPGGKRAVVLGAGGAARAAVHALKAAGASRVAVANRSPGRARALAAAMGCDVIDPATVAQEIGGAEIVVRCLPASAGDDVPGWLREGLVILDASYQPSAFSAAARAAGCRFVDGKEWLARQAVAGCERFTGSPGPFAAMRAALDVAVPAEERPRNVALIGFMGAGKSTVGRALAKRLGFSLVDVDQRIEEGTGATIRELFEKEGEASFRRREAAEIGRLASVRGAVVAVGGGAVISEENRRALSMPCVVVWLWASLAACLARADAATRPLLAGSPGDRVRALFDGRQPVYCRASDLVIDAGSSAPDLIAERIAREVGFSLGR